MKYAFAQNINGTDESGIIDTESLTLLCLCPESEANIILAALEPPSHSVDGWVTEKPLADHEFTMVTKTKIGDHWDYHIWTIVRIDTDEDFYFSLCDGQGNEWGPYEDLAAQFYKVI